MTERAEHVWIVDGVEEGMARIEEDGARMIVVPRYLIPPGAREGEVLRVSFTGGGGKETSITVTVHVDQAATEAALARSRATVEHASAESRKRDPGGDVVL